MLNGVTFIHINVLYFLRSFYQYTADLPNDHKSALPMSAVLLTSGHS
jgi:hypothetical protein